MNRAFVVSSLVSSCLGLVLSGSYLLSRAREPKKPAVCADAVVSAPNPCPDGTHLRAVVRGSCGNPDLLMCTCAEHAVVEAPGGGVLP